MSDALVIESYEAAKIWFARAEKMWAMGLLEYEGMERAEQYVKQALATAKTSGALDRHLTAWARRIGV